MRDSHLLPGPMRSPKQGSRKYSEDKILLIPGAPWALVQSRDFPSLVRRSVSLVRQARPLLAAAAFFFFVVLVVDSPYFSPVPSSPEARVQMEADLSLSETPLTKPSGQPPLRRLPLLSAMLGPAEASGTSLRPSDEDQQTLAYGSPDTSTDGGDMGAGEQQVSSEAVSTSLEDEGAADAAEVELKEQESTGKDHDRGSLRTGDEGSEDSSRSLSSAPVQGSNSGSQIQTRVLPKEQPQNREEFEPNVKKAGEESVTKVLAAAEGEAGAAKKGPSEDSQDSQSPGSREVEEPLKPVGEEGKSKERAGDIPDGGRKAGDHPQENSGSSSDEASSSSDEASSSSDEASSSSDEASSSSDEASSSSGSSKGSRELSASEGASKLEPEARSGPGSAEPDPKKVELAANLVLTPGSTDECKGRRVYELPIESRFNKDAKVPSQEWAWLNDGYTWKQQTPALNPESSLLKALEASSAKVWKLPPGKYSPTPQEPVGAAEGGQNQNSSMGFGLENQWPELKDTWYSTSQFGVEFIFPARLHTYSCRTEDPSMADAVYVPYYTGLDLNQFFAPPNPRPWDERHSNAKALARWLVQQPTWQRFNGSDHFFVSGRVGWDYTEQYGTGILEFPGMERTTGIDIEDNLQLKNDVSVPYPTIFHPPGRAELDSWRHFVAEHEKRVLVSFVGGQRGPTGARSAVFWQCREAQSCWLVDCSSKETECIYQWAIPMNVHLNSVFCLQPPGDTCTRRGVMDSILAGCIPVVFEKCSLQMQYPWHLSREEKGASVKGAKGAFVGSYFVYIPAHSLKLPQGSNQTEIFTPGEDGGNQHQELMIEEVLKRISPGRVHSMRKRLFGLIPQLTYGGRLAGEGRIESPGFEDAFDFILKGLLERIAKAKTPGLSAN